MKIIQNTLKIEKKIKNVSKKIRVGPKKVGSVGFPETRHFFFWPYETGSMTGILGQLKWEYLKKRRKDNRLILLYKGLKGKARIPTDDLIPKTKGGMNQHSLAFQIPSASKDVYQYSFFPQTIRDWNDLPESLISSSELSDDSVSKFTSLVRARD